MNDEELERIAAGYRTFVEEAESSPLYARLAADIAGDRDALRFLAGLPAGKRHPTLLLAALQYLHGAAPRHGAELRRLVVEDADRLGATMAARATQTNEPARCTGLLPALGLLHGPLALVEVGASAGLCLYPDRYGYDFDGVPVGPPSAVHLPCVTSGAVPVPERVPEVVARIGIDLNPLDPADPDDRAWLRALVWPGPYAAARLERLDAAAGIAGAEPATMLTGDVLDRLPDALDLVPVGCTPVVLHTAVLPYLPRDRRAAFLDLVRAMPVRWIAQEAPGVVPGTGEEPPGGWGTEFVLSLDGRPLARTAQHGGRIDWLGA